MQTCVFSPWLSSQQQQQTWDTWDLFFYRRQYKQTALTLPPTVWGCNDMFKTIPPYYIRPCIIHQTHTHIHDYQWFNYSKFILCWCIITQNPPEVLVNSLDALNARWQHAHAMNSYTARARRLLSRTRINAAAAVCWSAYAFCCTSRDGAFSADVYRAVFVRYRHYGHPEE